MATRPAYHWADRVALLILAAVAVIAAFTFRDYGLGWDDYTHSQYGDLLLKLYRSGYHDTEALAFVNLYKYGGGFDMASALAAKLLPFDLFETRRLMGAVVGIIGLIATWRTARRLGGPVAGLCALALIAACPLYYGHMFMNPKDAPFAAAMAVLLLGLVRAFDEYPKPAVRSMVLVGIGLGTAFGSRILVVLAVPYVVLALIVIVFAEAHSLGLRSAAARFGQFVWTLLPALVLAYLIMGLLWPWSIVAPLNPVRAALYFDTFFEKPWRELYEGVLIPVPEMPATYVPHLFALQLPLIMLVLGLVGMIGTLIAAFRSATPLSRRASLLIVALAPTLPIIIAMIARPALYNGLRHFVFLAPPIAVLGGLAAGWLFEHARERGTLVAGALTAVIAFGIAVPVASMVRLHPYEYVYFNALIGGVPGAKGKYMLDYWGLAFKQASGALRDHLAARHEQSPANRPWLVSVCGPQPPARVELGPGFETTANPRGADFVMSLGTFYCRALNAPVVAEVKREGVTFATVYDIRGRGVDDLLTTPPP